MLRSRRAVFPLRRVLPLAAILPIFAVDPSLGDDSLSSSGPIAIPVYKRSYEAPIGSITDDPRALDKRVGVGAIRGRTDEQYNYDPYGHRTDLGFYQRSWLDKDRGDSTLSPVSASVPAYVPTGSRDRDRSRDRSFERYPVGRRTGLTDYPLAEPMLDTRDGALRFDESMARQLREAYEASGWTPLADGRTREALSRFAKLADRNPDHGVPRVGLALASAALGDLEHGVEMMREALRVDPDALFHVPVEPRLRERLAVLAGGYAPLSSPADREFMRASLQYLGGKPEQAAASLERAVENGDSSESSTNLRQLIDGRSR